MPGITHYFTDNKAVDDSFDDPVAFEDSAVSRSHAMRNTYAHDQKPTMDLRDAIVGLAIKKKYEKSKNKSKHIYFVRHGESEMNVSGHFAGAGTNTPLTEKGRKQASAAGKQLKTKGIPVILL